MGCQKTDTVLRWINCQRQAIQRGDIPLKILLTNDTFALLCVYFNALDSRVTRCHILKPIMSQFTPFLHHLQHCQLWPIFSKIPQKLVGCWGAPPLFPVSSLCCSARCQLSQCPQCPLSASCWSVRLLLSIQLLAPLPWIPNKPTPSPPLVTARAYLVIQWFRGEGRGYAGLPSCIGLVKISVGGA